MLEAKIKDLQIQPLKSGGSLKLTEARMTKRGLETVDGRIKDHSLVVVTRDVGVQGFHHFITQREGVKPQDNLFVRGTGYLALVVPEQKNGDLVFKFDGKDEVVDPGHQVDDYPNRIIPVQVWEYWGGAIEVPILSEFLNDNLKRVGFSTDVMVARTSGPWTRRARQNFMENDNPIGAQDGYPVHPVSLQDAEAIFNVLNAEVDPSRFRYQILLDGVPFREIHNYAEAEINGVIVCQAKPCDRCDVTAKDQSTGKFSLVKPLGAFKELGAGDWIRPDNGKKVKVMGENWLPQGITNIRIGDKVFFPQLRVEPPHFETSRNTQITA